MQLQKQTHGRPQYIFGRLAFSGLAAVACGQQYWQRAVAGIIARRVAQAVAGHVARKQPWAGRLTGLSAGARQLGCSARAEALWSSNHAVCCGRSQKNPHDCCSIHPQPFAAAHSERSWAPRCSGLNRGPEGKLACERSARAFPLSPGARPAPDHRPIHSLRSFMTRPVVRRAARFGSTASVAPWGAPAAVARWGSLLLLRGTAQSALGRFLLLGSARGRPLPALRPWGACAHACLGAGRCLPKPKTRVPCECSATSSRAFPGRLPVAGAHRQNASLGQNLFPTQTFIQSRKEMLCLC